MHPPLWWADKKRQTATLFTYILRHERPVKVNMKSHENFQPSTPFETTANCSEADRGRLMLTTYQWIIQIPERLYNVQMAEWE